jgi:peroxiredoxin
MGKKGKIKTQKKAPNQNRLWVFAIVAVAVTGYLFYQARKEHRPAPPDPSASRQAPTAETAPQPALAAGDALPEVSLVSLSGERLELRAPTGSHSVLVYVFSPSCSVCSETIPAWKELYEEASAQSVEVIGISALGPMQTTNYIRQFDIPWSVFCFADRASMETFRLRRVPFTLLVEGGGEIALAMQGRLGSEQRAAISGHLQQTSD